MVLDVELSIDALVGDASVGIGPKFLLVVTMGESSSSGSYVSVVGILVLLSFLTLLLIRIVRALFYHILSDIGQ